MSPTVSIAGLDRYAALSERVCVLFEPMDRLLRGTKIAGDGGLMLRSVAGHWSLTTLREKLIKIGAKDVRHSKSVTFQMADVAVSRELYAAILERIQRFGVPPPLLQRG